MKEKTMEFDTLTLQFTIEEDIWQLRLAKSQTQARDIRQMGLITEAPDDAFVPVDVKEEGDSFAFSFIVDQEKKKWEDLKELPRNEKLRLLCNVARIEKYLATRITFFLHPDNLVFDDNLLPSIIYRGIRDVVPPFIMTEQGFLKQLKAFSIALFSKKYTFDQLYNGALENAKETEFERQVGEMTDLSQLITLLEESYKQEQKKTERQMQIVPIKRFRLFKQLSIIMIVVAVLLAAPLAYFGFVTLPYQHTLLDAHDRFLASDYGEVITTLEGENAEKLPEATKYILAYSYISVEHLSDQDKENIMKNVSLKSDENYLLYWIYNGRGDLDESLEKAKYIDDPVLIMHGLIKQMEAAKNDPNLSGTERDEKVSDLQDQLEKYQEEYKLEPDDNDTDEPANSESANGERTQDQSTEQSDERTADETDETNDKTKDKEDKEKQTSDVKKDKKSKKDS
ncbi:type VII secretion protein EssB [Lentibacillus sp. N15]|uniref:type VII secretion protein EssB n=1 Tax=Lentibacillus songyuanensis TaxID=3136161 RepID=UPI0031BAA2A0